jgi:hypothetical protein
MWVVVHYNLCVSPGSLSTAHLTAETAQRLDICGEAVKILVGTTEENNENIAFDESVLTHTAYL